MNDTVSKAAAQAAYNWRKETRHRRDVRPESLAGEIAKLNRYVAQNHPKAEAYQIRVKELILAQKGLIELGVLKVEGV